MTSLFISHNSKDKQFARKLAKDLQRASIKVWLDEAEIRLGDSLIDKLSTAIKEMDFLAVVLSKDSVSSEWVKKEVNIALNDEICGKRVKVLSLLLEPGEVPSFLSDKLYADFSLPTKIMLLVCNLSLTDWFPRSKLKLKVLLKMQKSGTKLSSWN